MRLPLLAVFLGVLIGCSGDEKAFGPVQPLVLNGEYSGTATYWQYAGTDSAETRTDLVNFNFAFDSTYGYEVDGGLWCGGYGSGHYIMDGHKMVINNESYYLMHCILHFGDIVEGEFTISGNTRQLVLYQEILDFQFTRRVVLEKK